MTPEEIEMLPENGGFCATIEPDPRDPSKRIKCFSMRPAFAMKINRDDPIFVWDREGRAWHIGYVLGVKHKARASPELDLLKEVY